MPQPHSNRNNKIKLLKFKSKYISEEKFPALPQEYENRLQVVMHTGYLLFIRNKFLFLGFIKSIEDKNLYVSYAILKSYWENVTAFGYYCIKEEELIQKGETKKAFELSRKMGLGGRGFLTEEMVNNKGRIMDDFKTPHIYTMMDFVDSDVKKIFDISSLFRELYDQQIAEGGHTTYVGLSIAGRWTKDKNALIPDINKSWDRFESASLLNLAALSSNIFFYYWDKFKKLEEINLIQ